MAVRELRDVETASRVHLALPGRGKAWRKAAEVLSEAQRGKATPEAALEAFMAAAEEAGVFEREADAAAFRSYFGGIVFNPRMDREKGRARGAWHRVDEHRRIVTSGPLKLNPIFLRGPGNMDYD